MEGNKSEVPEQQKQSGITEISSEEVKPQIGEVVKLGKGSLDNLGKKYLRSVIPFQIIFYLNYQVNLYPI